MRKKRFEIHSHTHYSNIRLLDCINRPKDLINRAIELGLSGITITDHECLSSHIEVNLYQQKVQKENPDFKIALGNEIYLTDERKSNQKYYHCILIALDEKGHKQLRELSSKAWINSYHDRGMERVPTLKSELEEIVSKNPGHIVATTACLGGELSSKTMDLILAESVGDEKTRIQSHNDIVNYIFFMKRVFGENFYIEIAPGKSKDQIMVNKRLVSIARCFEVKMVIGCDAHYLKKEDRFVHKAYLNSKNGEREIDSFYEYSYLQDEFDVVENLGELHVLHDEMVENSQEIYEKIQNYSLLHAQTIPTVHLDDIFWNQRIPHQFKTLNRLQNHAKNIQEKYWLVECLKALKEKNLYNEKYLERLEIEADVIVNIGEKLDDCLFAYFNTFKHYIDLFWEKGSIVGPGRGSATGFLSNYLLGITQLDPIQWDLPYWRSN